MGGTGSDIDDQTEVPSRYVTEELVDDEEYEEIRGDEQSSFIGESEEEEFENRASSVPLFEKALQSVLGPALDSTVWRLRSLHESQMDLTVQLNILTSILDSYRASTQPIQLKNTLTKINVCRQRLHAINTTLAAVEERLDRVKRRLLESNDGAAIPFSSP